MSKAIILLSGGLDSTVALYWARQHHDVVGAVSFDYGSKHNDKEIVLAIWHCTQLGISHDTVPLPFVNDLFHSDLLKSGGSIPEGHYADDNMKRTVVPFRNGIMLSIACGIAESRNVDALVIAAHSGDHAIYPDCREPFMKAIGDAMREGTYARTELMRPFIAMNKTDIVRLGDELGVDFGRTWSCYKGEDLQCGVCGTCVERRESFIKAGVVDPTVYQNDGPLPKAPVH